MAQPQHEPGRHRRERRESRSAARTAAALADALHSVGAVQRQPVPARLLSLRHRADSRDDAAARRSGRSAVPVHARPADDRLERAEGDGGRHRRSGDGRDAARRARRLRNAPALGQPRLPDGPRARLQRVVRPVRTRLVERPIGQARRPRARARRGLRAARDRRPLRVVRRPHVADDDEPVDDRLHVHGHRRRRNHVLHRVGRRVQLDRRGAGGRVESARAAGAARADAADPLQRVRSSHVDRPARRRHRKVPDSRPRASHERTRRGRKRRSSLATRRRLRAVPRRSSGERSRPARAPPLRCPA